MLEYVFSYLCLCLQISSRLLFSLFSLVCWSSSTEVSNISHSQYIRLPLLIVFYVTTVIIGSAAVDRLTDRDQVSHILGEHMTICSNTIEVKLQQAKARTSDVHGKIFPYLDVRILGQDEQLKFFVCQERLSARR